MLFNHTETQRLLHPLTLRAQSQKFFNAKIFNDRFAKIMLEKISDFQPIQAVKTNFNEKCKQQIDRCAWIDKKLMRFFMDYPKAQGVEVNSGLSTRFHRLSEQLDWPRFSWVSIDAIDAHQYRQAVFPALDNYVSFSSDSPNSNWANFLTQTHSPHCMIILGEHEHLNSWQDVDSTFSSFVQKFPDAACPIDLLITHSSKIDVSMLRIEGFAITTIDVKKTQQKNRHWMTRFVNTVSLGRYYRPVWITHLHLSLEKRKNEV